MTKMLNVGHVRRFPIKANDTLFTEIGMKGAAAGVEWQQVITIVEAEVFRVCEAAALAQLVTMVQDWTPEQWMAAKRLFCG